MNRTQTLPNAYVPMRHAPHPDAIALRDAITEWRYLLNARLEYEQRPLSPEQYGELVRRHVRVVVDFPRY